MYLESRVMLGILGAWFSSTVNLCSDGCCLRLHADAWKCPGQLCLSGVLPLWNLYFPEGFFALVISKNQINKKIPKAKTKNPSNKPKTASLCIISSWAYNHIAQLHLVSQFGIRSSKKQVRGGPGRTVQTDRILPWKIFERNVHFWAHNGTLTGRCAFVISEIPLSLSPSSAWFPLALLACIFSTTFSSPVCLWSDCVVL